MRLLELPIYSASLVSDSLHPPRQRRNKIAVVLLHLLLRNYRRGFYDRGTPPKAASQDRCRR